MGEWITLIALLFQIFKYFKDPEKEKEVRVQVSDIVLSAFTQKASPVAALWQCIEDVEGFADAFIADTLGVAHVGAGGEVTA